MFLTDTNLFEVVKKQYMFKFKSYSRVFSSLVFIQLFGLLFSLGSMVSLGTSTNGIEVQIHLYSVDMVIIVTILWAFITSILMTTKAYRNDDYLFVTNRLSGNLSNILFLISISLFAGMTSILSGFLLRVIKFYSHRSNFINDYSVLERPNELLIGIAAAFLYILLFAAIGYAVGNLIQIHKSFVVIVPVVLLGVFFIGENSAYSHYLASLYRFFFKEASLLLFTAKIVISTILLFVFSILLSNSREVRL